MRPELPERWKAAIVSVAALAFLCKILLALSTYGTNDVYAWERFAHWSRIFGAGIYQADPAFNHPPSMIHVLGALSWLATTTGVFFPFWLRLPAILADAASLWIVYRIFARRLDEPSVRWGLLLLAASPALVLVSGFHGNTDPVVMFFVLLSVWATEEGQSDWLSGAAFGAAMCVKVLPLIVLPVLFLCRPGLRRRVIFLGSAAAVVLLCWSPYLYRDPVAIVHRVLGYQSIYGHWGLSWLAFAYDTAPSWHDEFQRYEAYIAIAVITVRAFVSSRARTKPAVYAQVGLALFFFLAVSTGFGVQYLAWLVPWTVGIGIVPAAFFSAASGVFLFVTYNYWSGGFPWYLADSNYMGDFSDHLDYFHLLCWLSVLLLVWSTWNLRPSSSLPSFRARLVLSALAIPVLVYPVWRQVRIDARTTAPSIDRASIAPIHADENATLSMQLYSRGRYADAAIAARTAAALDPTEVNAWNSLARSCIQLGRWDEAINAVSNALRIAPDDEAANYNLALVRSHR